MKRRKTEFVPPDPQELFIPYYDSKELKLLAELYEVVKKSTLGLYGKERVLNGLTLLVKRDGDPDVW